MKNAHSFKISSIKEIGVNRDSLVKQETLDFENMQKRYRVKDHKDIRLDSTREKIIQETFEENGYQARKLNPRGQFLKNLEGAERKLIKDWFSDMTGIDNFFNFRTKGIPDFLIFKLQNSKITEVFFLEVKSDVDKLKQSQKQWLLDNEWAKVFLAKVEYLTEFNSENTIDPVISRSSIKVDSKFTDTRKTFQRKSVIETTERKIEEAD